MVYKLDFIYKIHCGTTVTDDVTVNIVVQGYPGSIPVWILTKKSKQLIYVFYILYVIYIVYILYIIYIAYICRVKRVWYMNRTSFTTYIGSPR